MNYTTKYDKDNIPTNDTTPTQKDGWRESDGRNDRIINKKRKRIFKIQKDKGEKVEIDDDDDDDCRIEESDGELKDEGGNKRVSAFSKVNFSKLKETEKDRRLKNLSYLITRLRKKIRNLETRHKSHTEKSLSNFIEKNLSINVKKGKDQADKINLDLSNLVKALNSLNEHHNFEYDDQRHVIENIINLIAEEKISLDSINFKKICSQIRMFLDKEKVKYISKKGQKIVYSFKEKDIFITPQEYDFYSKCKDNEQVIRMIFGYKDEEKEYPGVINFDNNPATPKIENLSYSVEPKGNISEKNGIIDNGNLINNIDSSNQNNHNLNNNVLRQLLTMNPQTNQTQLNLLNSLCLSNFYTNILKNTKFN